MRVLVVEDEALIRMLVCDLLEEAGFACAETADAAEALALLDAGLCKPEVLVTDYNLGPGLDGKALARGAAAPARPRHRLRHRQPGVLRRPPAGALGAAGGQALRAKSCWVESDRDWERLGAA